MAQQDIRVNALGLFFKNYGLGYEYIINDEIAAGVYINVSNGSLLLNAINDINGSDYGYSSVSIMPEFKYYYNPDFGADNRYFGAYLIYQNVSWNKLTAYDDNNNEIKYDMNNTSYGIGVLTGQKWVTNSGIYIESLIGIGKFFTSSIDFSDPNVEQYVDTKSYKYVSSYDFRFQVSVGYRIGGY